MWEEKVTSRSHIYTKNYVMFTTSKNTSIEGGKYPSPLTQAQSHSTYHLVSWRGGSELRIWSGPPFFFDCEAFPHDI